MAGQGWKAVLVLTALTLGLLVSQQMRLVATLHHTTRVKQGRILTFLVTHTLESNHTLEARAAVLASRLSRTPMINLTPARKQLLRVEELAGLQAAQGPGAEVTIHDATQKSYPGEPSIFELVHDQYILHIVAVLSAAGASAISINNQRVVATTAIFCAGPTIRVNGINYGSPFVIRAVGPSPALLQALAQDPDVQGWSQLVSIRVAARQLVKVPAYRLPVDFSVAKPAKVHTAVR